MARASAAVSPRARPASTASSRIRAKDNARGGRGPGGGGGGGGAWGAWRSEECSAQEPTRDREVDDEAGDVHQRGDEGRGRARRVEAETAQNERQERSGHR